ncbi:MAG: hypothetical protein K9J30_15240 [Bacteroidales bacterium]|nr:hypothetical protein [Bacteroidales bacterium]
MINFSALKKYTFPFLLVMYAFLFSACSESAREITIDSSFDNGSLGEVRIYGDTLVRGQTMHWIKRDMLGNQFYWFYFRLENVKGKRIQFELTNMAGTYRGNKHKIMLAPMQLVVSYDNENWGRLEDVVFDETSNTLTFACEFRENEAWIAYAHPYSSKRGDHRVSQMKEAGADIEVIGHSVLGRDIHLLTFPGNAVYSPGNQVVFITALQHAGENCGGYFIEGLIDALHEHPGLPDNLIFKIVPMVNPDGLYYGISRYNYAMEDLNSEWDDGISDTINKTVEPEILAIRNWIGKWKKSGGGIDLAIDVHSHSQFLKYNCMHIRDERMEALVRHVNDFWPLQQYYIPYNPSSGNFLDYFTDQEGSLAGTLELTQAHTGDGDYLDIEDYVAYGEGMLEAIIRFIEE